MKRILELDALRGLTAIVICLAHLGAFGKAEWVFTAVDLFFVISGYFITANLLREAGSAKFLRKFFIRRALRIWPAYYLALAACLILNRSLKWDAPPDGWLSYLTFTQNIQHYWGGAVPKFSLMFLHTWTLAIEEQFYLFWPFLVVLAGRRRLPFLATLFVVVPLYLRATGLSPYLLLTRCDGLAFGALLACLFGGSAANRSLWRLDLLFATAIVAAAGGIVVLRANSARLAPAWAESLGQLRACLGYFGVVGLVLNRQGSAFLRPLRVRAICSLGAISYGLYLYHPLVFGAFPRLYERHVVRKLGLADPTLKNLVMLAVCFLVAWASRRYFEEPILALKRKFRVPPPTIGEPWRLDEAESGEPRAIPQKISRDEARKSAAIASPTSSPVSSPIASEPGLAES